MADVSTPQNKHAWLTATHGLMMSCTNCALRQNSIQVVPGVGPADSPLMIVGEAPGADEDQQGIPFSGRAGQLLTKLITEAGGDRSKIFITNICKCRPLKNRDPEPTEIAACWRYLYNQLLIIRPKIVMTVGRISTEHVLTNFAKGFDPKAFRITKDHGKVYAANIVEHNYTFGLMPIMHTAYLLRGQKPAETDATREDIRQALMLAYNTP